MASTGLFGGAQFGQVLLVDADGAGGVDGLCRSCGGYDAKGEDHGPQQALQGVHGFGVLDVRALTGSDGNYPAALFDEHVPHMPSNAQ
jgi:hypothetical protein